MRGPGRISADVWLEPSNGRGWASVALNGDVAADNRYASAGIAQGIEPFEHLGEPWGVLLAQMPAYANAYTLTRAPLGWHRLTVAYDGKGEAVACVDGVCERTRVELGEYRPELICAGNSPSTPGRNEAFCSFRNISIGEYAERDPNRQN